MSVTNEYRADWAQRAVNVFQDDTETEDGDTVADLIANLLHLAVREGLDPLRELKRGVLSFVTERELESDGRWSRLLIAVEG